MADDHDGYSILYKLYFRNTLTRYCTAIPFIHLSELFLTWRTVTTSRKNKPVSKLSNLPSPTNKEYVDAKEPEKLLIMLQTRNGLILLYEIHMGGGCKEFFKTLVYLAEQWFLRYLLRPQFPYPRPSATSHGNSPISPGYICLTDFAWAALCLLASGLPAYPTANSM